MISDMIPQLSDFACPVMYPVLDFSLLVMCNAEYSVVRETRRDEEDLFRERT